MSLRSTILVLAALAAFPAAAKTLAAPPAESAASVRVTAELERSKLLAEKGGETFARIVLEGAPAPRRTDRLPVSLTLILDTSGSMQGEKIVQARAAAIAALDELQRGDKVSVVVFSDGAQALLPQAVVGEDDLTRVKRALARLQADGGTDMIAGLDVGGARARAIYGSSRTNRILLLSDGRPNVAEGLEERVAALAKENIATTTLGIGRDYDEDLMSKLADAGLGSYHFVERPEQMAGIFATELRSLSAVVAKEAVVSIALADGVEVVEVYGYAVSRGRKTVAIPVGDVFGGRRADILAKVRFPSARAGSSELLSVKVTYHDALAGQARRHQLPLLATFTTDEAAVAASVTPGVVEKAEQVRTAEAMKAAADAYAAGERERAAAIVAERKQSLSSYAASVGAAAAPAAARLSAELDDLRAEASAPSADAEVMKKKAKAKARAYAR